MDIELDHRQAKGFLISASHMIVHTDVYEYTHKVLPFKYVPSVHTVAAAFRSTQVQILSSAVGWHYIYCTQMWAKLLLKSNTDEVFNGAEKIVAMPR
jgi:hypothetical protein